MDVLNRFIMDHLSINDPISDVELVLSDFEQWKKRYLKKSNPLNFVRLNRIIPDLMFDYPVSWSYSMQLWRYDGRKKRHVLEVDNKISANVFDFFEKEIVLKDSKNWLKTEDSHNYLKYKFNPYGR